MAWVINSKELNSKISFFMPGSTNKKLVNYDSKEWLEINF